MSLAFIFTNATRRGMAIRLPLTGPQQKHQIFRPTAELKSAYSTN